MVKTPRPSAGDVKDVGSIPVSWKIPWRREQLPTPVSLPGESHGQRSLAGYSPWGHKNKTSNLKNPKRMGTSCPAVSQGSQDGGHPRARSSRGRRAGPGFGRLWVETDQEGSAMPRVTIRWCHKTVSLWFSPGSCLTLCDPMDRSARDPPSVTNSRSLLKLTYMESVTPSNHLTLCRPLLLPPSIFPSIGVFSKESPLPIRWPKDWSFSFSIHPSSEYSGPISCKIHHLTQPPSQDHCCPQRKSSQAVKGQPEPNPGRRTSHKVGGQLNNEISEIDPQTWKAAKWRRYALRVLD